MKISLPSVFSIALGFVVLTTSNDSFAIAQISENCLVQTTAISNSPNMTQAYLEYNQAIAQQTVTCVTDNVPCNIDVNSEIENLNQVCVDLGGQVYEPTLSVTCDNSNTKTKTTWTIPYGTCLGMNCSAEDITNYGNEAVQNATNVANDLLAPSGISCGSSFSAGVVATAQMGAIMSLISGAAWMMLVASM
jgi:hypothetical protein